MDPFKSIFTSTSYIISENTPSTKRLKLESIEYQSSVEIVKELARGNIELEQDKKNAEKKIVDLETEKKELELQNKELMEKLKEARNEIEKTNAKNVVLMDALTSYRKFSEIIITALTFTRGYLSQSIED